MHSVLHRCDPPDRSNCVVIGGRDVQKFNASLLQIGHRLDDVVGRQWRHADTFAIVKFENLIDLRFLCLRRFVDRQTSRSRCHCSSLCSSARVCSSGNILVIEAQMLRTPLRPHKLHPGLHLAEATLPNAMIDILQAGVGDCNSIPISKAGHERPAIIFALNEQMNDIAVSWIPLITTSPCSSESVFGSM